MGFPKLPSLPKIPKLDAAAGHIKNKLQTKGLSASDAGALLKKAGNKASEKAGEMSSMAQLKLQDAMQKKSQTMGAISNISKKSHETAKNIIGNLR